MGIRTNPLNRVWGPVVIVMAALGLSACAANEGVSTFAVHECKQISKKAQAKINWARVPTVDVRVRNDEFEPMIIRMTQGRPYILRIRNRDDGMHVFRASKFFEQNAVMSVALDGERAKETCFHSVSIPGRQTAEIRMVAVVDGHYEFEDNMLLMPLVLSAGPSGIIIIEERMQQTAGR